MFAIQPVPELAFILQTVGFGGAIGLAVAYRARRRNYTLDTWVITARWSLLGLAAGVVIVAIDAITSQL